MKRILVVGLLCLIHPSLSSGAIKTFTPTKTPTNTATVTLTPTITNTPTPLATGSVGSDLMRDQTFRDVWVLKNGTPYLRVYQIDTPTASITPTSTPTGSATPTPTSTAAPVGMFVATVTMDGQSTGASITAPWFITNYSVYVYSNALTLASPATIYLVCSNDGLTYPVATVGASTRINCSVTQSSAGMINYAGAGSSGPVLGFKFIPALPQPSATQSITIKFVGFSPPMSQVKMWNEIDDGYRLVYCGETWAERIRKYLYS